MKFGKIEKKVPIPEINLKVKYPWPDMKVGDSIFFEPEKGETLDKLNRTVSNSYRHYGYGTDKKFKTMLMLEENGIRVWRME